VTAFPHMAAFDTETDLLQPGLITPPLVCASYYDGTHALLLDPPQAREVYRELLKAPTILCNANLPYDHGVMLADAEQNVGDAAELLELLFAKYDRPGTDGLGEIHELFIAQALDAIAGGHLFKDPRNNGPLTSPETGEQVGRYSLSICCDLTLGRRTTKINDFWRKRYAILREIPMRDWPPEARQYPIDDVMNAWDVAMAQRGAGRVGREHEWQPFGARDACVWCGVELGYGTPPACIERTIKGKPFRNLEGMPREVKADLCLHLGAIWGLRVDHKFFARLRKEAQADFDKYVAEFRDFFKHDHEKGCVKRMAERGVLPLNPKDVRKWSDDQVKEYLGLIQWREEWAEHCVSSCDYGKEDQNLVKRLVATAYGATGVCPSCNGEGRRIGAKGNPVNCWPRNFKDSPTVPCEACDGEGVVDAQACFHCGGAGRVEVSAITCDGTGLDLSTAPVLPRTEGGGVSMNRDTLSESGDERLMHYGDDEFAKAVSTHVPFLEQGLDAPLCLSPNVLVASFRMSYYGVIQQMPREGLQRACFAARGQDGGVVVSVPDDYVLQAGERFIDDAD
jgi:hypothetical protein